MILKAFKIIFFLTTFFTFGQNNVEGVIIDKFTQLPIESVEIYNSSGQLLDRTNSMGAYSFQTENNQIELIYFSFNKKYI